METQNVLSNVWPEVYSSWQSKNILKWPVTTVEEHNIGSEVIPCLSVTKERIKGLIPFSETGLNLDGNEHINRARLMKFLGQEIAFIVMKIDESENLFIASRKKAIERLSAQTWPSIQEGQIYSAIIRRITINGAFVELNGIEAFLPIHEIRYGWVKEIIDTIKPGETYNVKIKNVDREKERITVSIKDLIPNPWPGAAKRYVPSRFNLYTGTITGIIKSGVFVEFEPGVNALCHHYRRDPYAINKGDIVAVEIYRVIPEQEKISGKISRIIKKAS